jgi:AraC family transcriptional regulator
VREVRLDFDLSQVCEALGEQLIVPPAPRLFRHDGLRHIAECLAVECEKPDRFSRLYIDSLTLAACIDFLRVDQENPIRSIGRLAPWQLRRVTEYITEHLSETVTLRELALITRLSQSQLGRAFKRSTGFSLHRWQLNARVAKAQELLLSSSAPHAQIALATGFSEQSHFSRVFKKVVGRSPAAWEREHRPLLTT